MDQKPAVRVEFWRPDSDVAADYFYDGYASVPVTNDSWLEDVRDAAQAAPLSLPFEGIAIVQDENSEVQYVTRVSVGPDPKPQREVTCP